MASEKDTDVNVYLFAVALGLVIGMLISVYYGWAASLMWEWFIAPSTSIHLGIAQASGIVLAIRMLLVNQTESKCGTKLKWGWVV